MEIEQEKQKFRIFRLIGIFILCSLIIISAILFQLLTTPSNFPKLSFFTIKKGQSIDDVAVSLKNAGYIRSVTLFKTWTTVFDSGKLIFGTYYFESGTGIPNLTSRLSNGVFGVMPAKITIPEGSTVEDIASIFFKKTKNFNAPHFLSVTKKSEGYFFPSTYTVSPYITADEAVTLLKNSFNEQINKLKSTVGPDSKEMLSKRLNDVVVMASIIEKEAIDAESRRIISGILWKRLENGWPLQVDATLVYVTGKTSLELTKDDLNMTSPFNTYKNKGLPDSAISNPGYDSLLATLEPTKTDFWYYLSDKDNKMHYAKTLAEHGANRQKYLGK